MRALLQRVSRAHVKTRGDIIGEIENGLLLLLGISDEDKNEDLEYILRKTVNMRIFEDDKGKMNLSLTDVGGSLLVVSQFTLYADTKKGNRPSFTGAGSPDFSKSMYLKFLDTAREMGTNCASGEFGAHMEVSLVNDGPVTIFLDSRSR